MEKYPNCKRNCAFSSRNGGVVLILHFFLQKSDRVSRFNVDDCRRLEPEIGMCSDVYAPRWMWWYKMNLCFVLLSGADMVQIAHLILINHGERLHSHQIWTERYCRSATLRTRFGCCVLSEMEARRCVVDSCWQRVRIRFVYVLFYIFAGATSHGWSRIFRDGQEMKKAGV